jgi:hypothetical protein
MSQIPAYPEKEIPANPGKMESKFIVTVLIFKNVEVDFRKILHNLYFLPAVYFFFFPKRRNIQ